MKSFERATFQSESKRAFVLKQSLQQEKLLLRGVFKVGEEGVFSQRTRKANENPDEHLEIVQRVSTFIGSDKSLPRVVPHPTMCPRMKDRDTRRGRVKGFVGSWVSVAKLVASVVTHL